MANPNVGQTQAMAWEKYVGKSPEDQIHDDYWLFHRLSRGESFRSFDGGRDIRITLEYAVNTTVTSYTDTETIPTSRVDVFDEAVFAWKEYVGVVVMSELEKALNQGSGGKFPLKGAKMKNLFNGFRKTLNEGMYSDGTGNSSKDVGGLQHLVATSPTTGTVGSINRQNFTFWRNQQASGAQTTTAFDNLRSTMRSQYNSASQGVSKKHPDFAITTQTVFEGYEALLVPQERYTMRDKTSGADAGFKNEVLKFKGLEMAFDLDTPSGIMYLLNSEHVGLAYQKGYWMNGLPMVDPANQTVSIFRVMTIANMFTDNPRRLSAITSIS